LVGVFESASGAVFLSLAEIGMLAHCLMSSLDFEFSTATFCRVQSYATRPDLSMRGEFHTLVESPFNKGGKTIQNFT
jgi:hypothetical protein